MSTTIPASRLPSDPAPSTTDLRVRTIGGPTVVIDVGGMCIVVDPTFDAPGSYDLGGGRVLTKTAGPAVCAEAIGAVDLVLLSHDQHADNLDLAGRRLLASSRRTLTTPVAAERLQHNAEGMPPWSRCVIARPDGGALGVVAVPAQHGPDGTEHLTGPVTGFVLQATGAPHVYISGDNASLPLVEQIAARFPGIELAIVFAGAARTALLGDACLTLTSDQTVDVARIMPRARILPVHCDSWAHFSEGGERILAAFEHAELLDRLIRVDHGEHVIITN